MRIRGGDVTGCQRSASEFQAGGAAAQDSSARGQAAHQRSAARAHRRRAPARSAGAALALLASGSGQALGIAESRIPPSLTATASDDTAFEDTATARTGGGGTRGRLGIRTGMSQGRFRSRHLRGLWHRTYCSKGAGAPRPRTTPIALITGGTIDRRRREATQMSATRQRSSCCTQMSRARRIMWWPVAADLHLPSCLSGTERLASLRFHFDRSAQTP